MQKLKLNAIIASTRPGRKGIHIANWAIEQAKKHGRFDVQVHDLMEINLPIYDEPTHPSMKAYVNQHTKDWSAKVESGEVFMLISPEYNHFPPPPLVNALDYVYQEWNYKPLGFVGYGGIAGGIRSNEHLIPLLTTLKIVPLVEAVSVQFFTKYIDDKGVFNPLPEHESSITKMLDELAKWGDGLKAMREANKKKIRKARVKILNSNCYYLIKLFYCY